MIAVDADIAIEPSVGGIVLSQVRVGLGIAQVIDGHDVEVGLPTQLVDGADHIPADTAITVDGDFDSHS